MLTATETIGLAMRYESRDLRLNRRGLKEVPVEVAKMPWLETLDLRDNEISSLPSWLQNCRLRHLYLHRTPIQPAIPPEILGDEPPPATLLGNDGDSDKTYIGPLPSGRTPRPAEDILRWYFLHSDSAARG